jgi:hypothetical protein
LPSLIKPHIWAARCQVEKRTDSVHSEWSLEWARSARKTRDLFHMDSRLCYTPIPRAKSQEQILLG